MDKLIIEALRRERGIKTCRELADRAGLSPGTISAIETGRNKCPSSRTLRKIADALGVKITDLWGRVEIVRD
jgi:transcriptional regulator with XRE-family HTH domain